MSFCNRRFGVKNPVFAYWLRRDQLCRNLFGLALVIAKFLVFLFTQVSQKSWYFRFSLNTVKPISINGSAIEYTDTIVYLGTTIISNKGLNFSTSKNLLSFYCASNSILTVVNKPSEEVLMHLLYANSIPILTYALAVKVYSSRQMHYDLTNQKRPQFEQN